jgi:hypothetical protein
MPACDFEIGIAWMTFHRVRWSAIDHRHGLFYAGLVICRITDTVKIAHKLRLKIAIGHDLDLKSLNR